MVPNCMDDDKPNPFTGTIKKKHGMSYSEHYVELQNGHMSLDPNANQDTATPPSSRSAAVYNLQSATVEDRPGCKFYVRVDKKDLKFDAASADDKAQWMSAIHRQIAMARGGAPGDSFDFSFMRARLAPGISADDDLDVPVLRLDVASPSPPRGPPRGGAPPGEPTAVHLMQASGLPPSPGGHRDVCLKMWFVDDADQVCSDVHQWPSRSGTAEPVWNSVHKFAIQERAGQKLCMQLFYQDWFTGAEKLIGVAETPWLELLRSRWTVATVDTTKAKRGTSPLPGRGVSPCKLLNKSPARSPVRGRSPSLSLPSGSPLNNKSPRSGWVGGGDEPPAPSVRLGLAKEELKQKTVFVVRHGQSTWNKAQADRDVVAMFSDTDHPLNDVGVYQAEALQVHITRLMEEQAHCHELGPYEAALLRAESVFSSPLARAVQTCLIGMKPLLANRSVRLMAAARERRNFGGRDTSGAGSGQDIVGRLRKHLHLTYSPKASELMEIAVDTHEVEGKWWSDSAESQTDFALRMREFLVQLEYLPEAVLVVVGHSHFFREMFRSCLSEAFAADHPAMVEELQARVLPNCGMAAVDMDFSLGKQMITNVHYMFGMQIP